MAQALNHGFVYSNPTPARRALAVRLLSRLSYDKDTGVFFWLVAGGRKKAGDIAGYASQGYVRIANGGVNFMAHRLAWLAIHGEWPTGQIDHLNGDRADNRIANLRDVDAFTNQQNKRSALRTSKIGLLGVVKWRGRFRADIKNAERKNVYLGMFDTAEAAHAAYVAAKRELHPGCTL